MDCSEAREAISALLDSEAAGVLPSELSLHLAECASCAAWREQAHAITRRVRLVPVQPAPAADPELISAIRAELSGCSRAPAELTGMRLGLVAIALVQIVLTVPGLIFGKDRDAPLHVAHELGSFGMALAVGFLIVAWQPARARGMHLLVGAAALLLVVTAVIDLLGGHTSLSDEAPHLVVLAGWLLMYLLDRDLSAVRERGGVAPGVERRAASA